MPNPFKIQPQDTTNQLKDLYNAIRQSKDPMQLFRQLANQNPNLKPILGMLNNSTPQQVFNALCQQRGINPNEFIKSITG